MAHEEPPIGHNLLNALISKVGDIHADVSVEPTYSIYCNLGHLFWLRFPYEPSNIKNLRLPYKIVSRYPSAFFERDNIKVYHISVQRVRQNLHHIYIYFKIITKTLTPRQRNKVVVIIQNFIKHDLIPIFNKCTASVKIHINCKTYMKIKHGNNVTDEQKNVIFMHKVNTLSDRPEDN